MVLDSSGYVGPEVPESQKGAGLVALTWNIAAINNNPFEYYITHPDPKYNELMEAVQEFIDSPGVGDVAVEEVFTPAMFTQLKCFWIGNIIRNHGRPGFQTVAAQELMDKESWAGTDKVAQLWASDFSKRKIISGFLKDKEIGSKRLASMPDRITNTIATTKGDAYRPCVINLYEGALGSTEQWWAAWSKFMFHDALEIKAKAGVESIRPCTMLGVISASKYPALTAEEEAISIPLQALCLAIFDVILVHMLNQLAPQKWHALKLSMCEALGSKKGEKILSLLHNVYADADIVFLQEVAAEWLRLFQASAMAKTFALLAPGQLDAKRNQNSVILVRKELFNADSASEVTGEVIRQLPQGVDVPVAAGDICAYLVTSMKGIKWLLVSFHGDTDGLATIPVMNAVCAVGGSQENCRLMFGLDANTYARGQPGKTLDVAEFAQAFCSAGLTSCWGDKPDPTLYTTFNTRTYLQAQLNKAVRMADRKTSPLTDRNPKDFILFRPTELIQEVTIRDNTGHKAYDDEMPFPTLDFPSDHGVVATALRVRKI